MVRLCLCAGNDSGDYVWTLNVPFQAIKAHSQPWQWFALYFSLPEKERIFTRRSVRVSS
jgi:hypothetical protein